MKRAVLLVCIVMLYGYALTMAGCGDITVARNYSVGFDGYKIDKSYEIGKERTEYIGNPLVKWSKVSARFFKNPQVFIAKDDFAIGGPYMKRHIFLSIASEGASKGDVFYLFGTTQYEDVNYYVIGKTVKINSNEKYVDGENEYYFLVNENGVLNQDVLIDHFLDRKLISVNSKAKEPEIKFTMTNISRKPTPDFTKELIFGGVNNTVINSTYREYTSENMAKPVFYQNLSYQKSIDTITFQGFKIKVSDVTNEKITYTVLEDDLKDNVPTGVGSL